MRGVSNCVLFTLITSFEISLTTGLRIFAGGQKTWAEYSHGQQKTSSRPWRNNTTYFIGKLVIITYKYETTCFKAVTLLTRVLFTRYKRAFLMCTLPTLTEGKWAAGAGGQDFDICQPRTPIVLVTSSARCWWVKFRSETCHCGSNFCGKFWTDWHYFSGPVGAPDGPFKEINFIFLSMIF